MSTTPSTTPQAPADSPAAAVKQRLPLAVTLARQQGGPPLESRLLDHSDLLELEAEAWFNNIVRKGAPQYPLDEVTTNMAAEFESGSSGPLKGFSIQLEHPQRPPTEYHFSRDAVSEKATHIVHELVAAGTLQLDDAYHHELSVASEAPQRELETDNLSISTQSAPLSYAVHDLEPLLRQSTSVGNSGDLCQVFYVQEAFEKAEEFARRGGNRQPPVETGGFLIGTLLHCPRSGELYTVVLDVLEAQDADSQKFSLEFSGKTWTRMQAILRARRKQPGMQSLRLLGQAHGHPFPPLGGAPPCELCETQTVCSRHTCFVSLDDVNWTRAVFPRQPWRICHIFGVNARGEHVDKLFGQRNGQLLERGFRLLPAFDLRAAAPAAGE